MKASELIAELQAAIDAHGDLELTTKEGEGEDITVEFVEPVTEGELGTLLITME